MSKEPKIKLKILSENLKRERESKGFTQESFAEAIASISDEPCSARSVSDWERGISEPKKYWSEITTLLNVTEEELRTSSHDKLYRYDQNFTSELHKKMSSYASGIGLNNSFLKYVKQCAPDEMFPLYSPFVTEKGKYCRQQNADAFKVEKSNEFQREIKKGKTVNLSYADLMFLKEVQDEVINYISYLFFKRKAEMSEELRALLESTTEYINGVPVYDTLPEEELLKFDKYLKYMRENYVSSMIKKGEQYGKESKAE